MIDKVTGIVHMVFIVCFTILVSGCGADRPLKQPTPNLASVVATTSEASDGVLQCGKDSHSTPKKIAMLHIGMAHPEQSRLFPKFQELFSKRLLQRTQLESSQQFRDATHITIQPHQVTLLGRVDSDMKNQLSEIGRQFDSQIIVSSTISKIEMSQSEGAGHSEDAHPLDNISQVLERISDKLSAVSWRKVSVKFQLFDGHTGEPIVETELEQKIALKSGEPFFLLNSPAEQEAREQQMLAAVDTLISKQMEIINQTANCTAVRGQVIATDNITATINIGTLAQISVGDQFELIQPRLIHTDNRGIEHLKDEKIATLRITSVQLESATGEIENLLRSAEIQRGDPVIGY
jgi:hypothetical protein